MIDTGEEVQLTETAEILELLFQYCYPRRGPSLNSLPLSTVKELAESVEKYQVYAALEPCKERMEDFITSHPLDTFLYAIKHGYPKLVQESEEKALYQDPVELFRIASEHNLVDVACMVAERSLGFQPHIVYACVIPKTFIRGAMALQTNHIFSVLKYALKHNREDLMDLAASVSVKDPKFALAADQLTDYETLAAWLRYYDQFKQEPIARGVKLKRENAPFRSFWMAACRMRESWRVETLPN